ncbi:hypothetical protein [Noviherbaspirillum denitrificans]|uniref:Uncharacterized protein n=1 Tax=Noviherbaspirillum denitrificans TaxID=1968433 RepID=A0A254TI64_9BURK|nr:hypothetical protein [Noviherbaspirillum denitrificans]OWW22321.1 hypothetical protein AYR66_25325 [Noviherbaspirillum denitrificans]
MTSASASPVRGGTAGAEARAVAEADKLCAEQVKEIMVTNTQSSLANAAGAGSASVTLRCLAQGDRELQRPDYRSAPNVIIQDARK